MIQRAGTGVSVLRAAVLVLPLLSAAPPGHAQQTLTPEPVQGTAPPVPDTLPGLGTPTGPADLVPAAPDAGSPRATVGEAPVASGSLDYAAWERLARRGEAMVAGGIASALLLEQARAQIADWREAFLAAQGGNAARIATLRTQVDALGPAPADGVAEADELAARRRELTGQLVRLQSPVIAAEEAYSRADGLIREIDRLLRERQTRELTRLWPAPVNPANWPAAAESLAATLAAFWRETAASWTNPERRAGFVDQLPRIAGLLFVAFVLIWRGRRWFERLPYQLMARSAGRGRDIWAFLASLGQIVVPVAGLVALVAAINETGLPGPLGGVLAESLVAVGFTVFAARWLGLRLYPRGGAATPIGLPEERRAEARIYVTALGLLLAVESVRRAVFDPLRQPESANAVLAFPGLLLTGLVLFRMGQMMRRHVAAVTPEGEAPSYRDRLTAILGRVAMTVGVAGPVLAAVGYVSAGAGLVYPATVSLALVGLLLILQRFVADLFALFTGAGDAARDGLGPVLAGFFLTILSLPMFALIWGVRAADLGEVMTRLREGFAIGQTRVSPGDFILFAVIFGAGYAATRFLQGALRSTILPKTRLDSGGQNAIVAGTGYLGIFIAGLIAINSTGLDLSGLAIVAGALSVGIGFGLQTIVSNFVSGIILLIERPVSEGDWIEVGTVSGIVKRISVRATRIQTFDRSDVIVPNADLVTGRVTNWTRFSMSGRLIVPVTVPFTADSRRVEHILTEIAMAQPMAVLNPAPLALFTGFAPEAMLFEIRLILRDVNFSPNVRSEINHAIVRRFDEEGIAFSSAHRDFVLRQAAEAAAATLDDAALAALMAPKGATA